MELDTLNQKLQKLRNKWKGKIPQKLDTKNYLQFLLDKCQAHGIMRQIRFETQKNYDNNFLKTTNEVEMTEFAQKLFGLVE